MDNEFGSDFITISDEDGNEFELEHLDTIEVDGTMYMAFAPANMDESDEDYGMSILKVVPQGEEDILVTIDDEDELEAVYTRFMEQLFDDEEESVD